MKSKSVVFDLVCLRPGLVAFLAVSGVSQLPAFASPAMAADASCVMHGFDATVRQGPSAGTEVSGDLELQIAADGTLSGDLKPASGGAAITVTGQAMGRAINLAFDLGKVSGVEQYLFGVGTVAGDICNSPTGGPFVGPQPGDSGDWLCCKDVANS